MLYLDHEWKSRGSSMKLFLPSLVKSWPSSSFDKHSLKAGSRQPTIVCWGTKGPGVALRGLEESGNKVACLSGRQVVFGLPASPCQGYKMEPRVAWGRSGAVRRKQWKGRTSSPWWLVGWVCN